MKSPPLVILCVMATTALATVQAQQYFQSYYPQGFKNPRTFFATLNYNDACDLGRQVYNVANAKYQRANPIGTRYQQPVFQPKQASYIPPVETEPPTQIPAPLSSASASTDTTVIVNNSASAQAGGDTGAATAEAQADSTVIVDSSANAEATANGSDCPPETAASANSETTVIVDNSAQSEAAMSPGSSGTAEAQAESDTTVIVNNNAQAQAGNACASCGGNANAQATSDTSVIVENSAQAQASGDGGAAAQANSDTTVIVNNSAQATAQTTTDPIPPGTPPTVPCFCMGAYSNSHNYVPVFLPTQQQTVYIPQCLVNMFGNPWTNGGNTAVQNIGGQNINAQNIAA